MKITLIHGQNHMGSTYHIGKLLAEQFGNSDIQEFFLPKDLEHFCQGCYQCVENEEKCPFYNEKSRIMQAVEAADLLIFTTPTYCMRASASMKAFIDLTFTYWMAHKPRECMFSKKAVVISTAAGTGTKSAIKDITNTLFYWGVPYIKEYGVAVQAMSWKQVSPKKKAKINKDIAKLASTIENAKIHVGIKTRFMFSIMRMMQIKDWGSGELEKEYWKKNGWLDKKRPWKTR
ncbi:MAG: NAD(P)H-dependent oxidoreductase [Lachnospiraceae bacterium]|nr:NAD(P)H-dependent oxidoreductase [Lachnospiraceae bacterium]